MTRERDATVAASSRTRRLGAGTRSPIPPPPRTPRERDTNAPTPRASRPRRPPRRPRHPPHAPPRRPRPRSRRLRRAPPNPRRGRGRRRRRDHLVRGRDALRRRASNPRAPPPPRRAPTYRRCRGHGHGHRRPPARSSEPSFARSRVTTRASLSRGPPRALFASRDWSPGETAVGIRARSSPSTRSSELSRARSSRAAQARVRRHVRGNACGRPRSVDDLRVRSEVRQRFATPQRSRPSSRRERRGDGDSRAPANVRLVETRDDAAGGAPRLFVVVTTRHVRAGEEFLATYGDAFWEEERRLPSSRMKTRSPRWRRRRDARSRARSGTGKGAKRGGEGRSCDGRASRRRFDVAKH